MMNRLSIVWLAVAYTCVVAAGIALIDDSSAMPVFAVAYAWFWIGRCWHRLGLVRWGLQ